MDSTKFTRISYRDEWFDNVIAKCRMVWEELARDAFKRYRQIGQIVIKSGYNKGQWRNRHKKLILDKLGISQRTFSSMVQLAEMSEKEFNDTIHKFPNIHKWTNPTPKRNYMIEKQFRLSAFNSEEEAEAWFSKRDGELKGRFWVGIVDKRVLEKVGYN